MISSGKAIRYIGMLLGARLAGKARARSAQQQYYASLRGLSTWRPLYMSVLRSIWWGRRNSPQSLSPTSLGFFSASAERRMPRREGDVFRFGTAIKLAPESRFGR